MGLIGYGIRCSGQTHCLSLSDSRRLHEDAVKRYYFEALADSLSSQVDLLHDENKSLRTSYELIVKLERKNLIDLRQNIKNHKTISESLEEEKKHLEKKVKSRAWQRNGLGVIAIAILVLSVSN